MDILEQLKEANKRRSILFGNSVEDWSLPQWGNALAGETGELCNIIKKIDRGDIYDRDRKTRLIDALAKEAGDILTYLDLLCQRAGVDLKTALIEKFNEKSDDIGTDIKLGKYYNDISERDE
jgi:NTP pyrophosphatase (non-canonical NTP hydrolase)